MSNQSVLRAVNALNNNHEISLDFRQHAKYASIKYVLNRIDILINVTTVKSFFAYILQQVFTGKNKEIRAFYSFEILLV